MENMFGATVETRNYAVLVKVFKANGTHGFIFVNDWVEVFPCKSLRDLFVLAAPRTLAIHQGTPFGKGMWHDICVGQGEAYLDVTNI